MKLGWKVALYDRLPSGKRSKYTFDVLFFHTRREARYERRKLKNDRRFIPVVEREQSKGDVA